MKCFNCGNDTNNYLCENCHTEKWSIYSIKEMYYYDL